MICTVLLVYLFWVNETVEKRARKQTIDSITEQLSATADSLDKRLVKAERIPQVIAAELSANRLDQYSVKHAMAKAFNESRHLYGIGVAYDPEYTWDGELYGPYYSISNGQPKHWQQIEDNYDYTEFKERSRWYFDPLLEGEMWVRPHIGNVTKTLILEYGVPFYHREGSSDPGEKAGVAYISLGASYLEEVIDSLIGVGTYDFTFMFSQEGRYFVHPRKEYVSSEVSMFERIWEMGNEELNAAAIQSVKGESGHVSYTDPFTGASIWYFYEPIPSTKWVLGIAVNMDEDAEASNTKRHRMLTIIFLMVIGLSCLMFYLIARLQLGIASYSWLSTVVSILLSLGIAYIWDTANRYPDQAKEEKHRIVGETTMNNYLDDYFESSRDTYHEEPLTVRTGVFLKSIEFLSGTNVQVTGYIWQKYIDGVHDSLDRGFILPEADEFEKEIAYREPTEDGELIGWSFSATLRQYFDYRKYPVDRQDVWLRLWHANFQKNVILIPDLDAYQPTINPITKPGLERGLVLSGWEMESSYFNFQKHSYNTNFGSSNYIGMVDFPELYFHTGFKRNFLGPVVSKLIPTIVAGLILFALLLTCTNKNLEMSGFSVNSIVAGCAALFFVVVLEHISLRESLDVSHLIYFEYYYFALYALMILVMADASLFISKKPYFIITYRHNLIPKLLFWPVYLSIIYYATWTIFY